MTEHVLPSFILHFKIPCLSALDNEAFSSETLLSALLNISFFWRFEALSSGLMECLSLEGYNLWILI